MANLPEPDWVTLFESAKRAKRAFDAEQSAVEAALINAFHDGKIRARGRCRSFFGHHTLVDVARYIWDRADVIWEDNEFAIPDDRVGREIHIFSDVVVYREDLEEWINGAVPDSQHEPQEPAEIPVPEEPKNEPGTLPERAEGWLEAVEGLRKTKKISWRDAASRVAGNAGVDSATVERETRRIRKERGTAGAKSGKKTGKLFDFPSYKALIFNK